MPKSLGAQLLQMPRAAGDYVGVRLYVCSIEADEGLHRATRLFGGGGLITVSFFKFDKGFILEVFVF